MDNKEPRAFGGDQATGQEESIEVSLPPQAVVERAREGSPAPNGNGSGGLVPPLTPEARLRQKLLKSGIPVGTVQSLISSGHYRPVTAEEARRLVGVPREGWVVKFLDLAGDQPLMAGDRPFVRLRLDVPLEPRNGKRGAKYLTPKGAGCRPYFSPLLPAATRDPKGACDVDITEGENKADAACAHGFATIGLSGVDCAFDQRSGKSDFLPELAAINWQGRTVRLVPDSDIAHNDRIQAAMRKLALELTSRGAHVLIVTIPCEPPVGAGNPTPERWKNGLDDFIARHGVEAYRIVRSRARPCVKKVKGDDGEVKLEWCWTPEPGRNETRTKALLAHAVFKDSFAWDPSRGGFVWDGCRWRPVEGKKATECLARPFLHWCDAMGWETTGLGSALDQLGAELTQQIVWDPPEWIAFTNGTLNTITGEFSGEFQRDHRLTFQHNFRFDPDAECPSWMRFLAEALGREGLQQLLRAAFRHALQPKDRSHPYIVEAIFDFLGKRGRGKGVVFEVLVALVGGTEEGGGAGLLTPAMLNDPQALFNLIGKRIAVDPDASGHVDNAGQLNAIASNEPVGVKKLYINSGCSRLGVTVFRFCNDDITVSGGGKEGLGRRIITFPFVNEPKKRDRHLKARLRDEELSGIFNWAWSMPLAEAEREIITAARHEEIAAAAVDAAMRREPVLRFLAELYGDGPTTVAASSIWEQWQDWAGGKGQKAGAMPSFSADVRKVATESFQKGRLKVTYYVIPAMDTFDWIAHLGLETGDEEVEANAESRAEKGHLGGSHVEVMAVLGSAEVEPNTPNTPPWVPPKLHMTPTMTSTLNSTETQSTTENLHSSPSEGVKSEDTYSKPRTKGAEPPQSGVSVPPFVSEGSLGSTSPENSPGGGGGGPSKGGGGRPRQGIDAAPPPSVPPPAIDEDQPTPPPPRMPTTKIKGLDRSTTAPGSPAEEAVLRPSWLPMALNLLERDPSRGSDDIASLIGKTVLGSPTADEVRAAVEQVQ